MLIPSRHISDGSPAGLALPIDADAILYLKADIAIGGDTLEYVDANLDFKRRVLAEHNCDFETPIKVLAKDHSRQVSRHGTSLLEIKARNVSNDPIGTYNLLRNCWRKKNMGEG